MTDPHQPTADEFLPQENARYEQDMRHLAADPHGYIQQQLDRSEGTLDIARIHADKDPVALAAIAQTYALIGATQALMLIHRALVANGQAEGDPR